MIVLIYVFCKGGLRMSYKKCLELTGATVYAFKEFGSYQGDWWALVKYQGKTGWISGSYGSCSGCDAFQSEFDLYQDDHTHVIDGKEIWCYNIIDDLFITGCPKCEDMLYRLSEFGKRYLEHIMTQEEAEKKASENEDWDLDAKGMLEWIQKKGVV
jgi:hypothetical protein